MISEQLSSSSFKGRHVAAEGRNSSGVHGNCELDVFYPEVAEVVGRVVVNNVFKPILNHYDVEMEKDAQDNFSGRTLTMGNIPPLNKPLEANGPVSAPGSYLGKITLPSEPYRGE